MSNTSESTPPNEIILWLQEKIAVPLDEIVARTSTTNLLRAHGQMYIFLMSDGFAEEENREQGRGRKALFAVSDELARRIDKGRAE